MENFTHEELSMIASVFTNKSFAVIIDKRRKGVDTKNDALCQLLQNIATKAQRMALNMD